MIELLSSCRELKHGQEISVRLAYTVVFAG
jgi:hypothetical protein